MSAQPHKISVPNTLSTIDRPWSQKLVANINSAYDIKIAKFRDSFIWHSHPDTDEFFYCLSGTFTLHFKEDAMSALEDVVMKEGDVLVVPRGMRHRPAVEEGKEASAMVIEVAGVVNTGDAEGESAEKMRNPIVDARGQA